MIAAGKAKYRNRPYIKKLLVIAVFAVLSILSLLICTGIGTVRFGRLYLLTTAAQRG